MKRRRNDNESDDELHPPPKRPFPFQLTISAKTKYVHSFFQNLTKEQGHICLNIVWRTITAKSECKLCGRNPEKRTVMKKTIPNKYPCCHFTSKCDFIDFYFDGFYIVLSIENVDHIDLNYIIDLSKNDVFFTIDLSGKSVKFFTIDKNARMHILKKQAQKILALYESQIE